MNRHYTTQEYEAVCGYLRKAFDHPAITTDVIVGFPGETEEEFAETMAFLERVGFYEMHVFKYSRREGTRAASMPDQVPEPVKARRSDTLLRLEKTMSRRFRESFLGEDIQVLLEEEALIDGRWYMIGHTREYVRAAVSFEELGELGPKGAEGNAWRGRLVRGTGREILTEDILKSQLKR